MSQSQRFAFDRELIARYDRPGPRYTSYPTAPHFTADFGPDAWQEELARSNERGAPISLYAHIPFCETQCFFCGCNMIATKRHERSMPYLEVLIREFDHYARTIDTRRPVSQLHLGGGTPTFLAPDEIRHLMAAIHDRFTMAADAEVSCEIDPRRLSREHLAALRETGFNRISMGVQDFETAVQRAVNRIQPESLTRQVYDWCRELGFASINLDLMYGLPHQTPETFRRTVATALTFGADRFAVFNYAHLPSLKRHMAVIQEADLPSPETKLTMLQIVGEALTEAGYAFIGMDHFAKPDDELAVAQREGTLYRNFQGYTTRAGADLLAAGMTAISQTRDVYAQNEKELEPYTSAITGDQWATVRGVRLTEADQMHRHVINRLMCDFAVDTATVLADWSQTFDSAFPDARERLAPMVQDGLARWEGAKLVVEPMGRLLVRNLAMVFDARLATSASPTQFSRTI
jgi:oxygen-independent coproporphyrinogen-3 oxidase